MKMSVLVTGVAIAMLCAGCSRAGSPTSPSQTAAGAAAGVGDPSARPASAASVPFKGTLEGTQSVTPLQPPLAQVNGHATGTATHLGRFTVQFPHVVNFALARGEGVYTFTAANGDTLTATFTGTATVGPITSIVEEAVITGGTGRFAGATGSFKAGRQFNQATGVTTGSFEGTISAPGAPGT